jgi:hypothetical protein
VSGPAQRSVTRALAAALWATTLLFALTAFTPERDAIESFNSDDAISILMANEPHVTPFHLYYFGQDRFGGWPHLLLAAASRVVGPITPVAFSRVQVAWAWLGAIPLWQIAGEFAPGALVAYLAAFALPPRLTEHLLSASQPYSWQIGALFWTWWALRKLSSALRRPLLLIPVAFLLALLSVWGSRASVPMVVALAAIEVSRNRQPRKLRLSPIAIAIGAGLAEAVLRAVHARYSRAHFGRDYRTAVRTDFAHLGENLRGAFDRMVELTPGWLSVGAIAAGLFGLFFWILARRRGGRPLAAEEPALLAGTFAMLATTQLALCVATNWARINDYAPRYFVLSILFACLIAGVAVAWIATLVLPRAAWLVLLAGAGLFFAVRPSPGIAAEFPAAQDAARAVARIRPHAIVWGDYWSTYRLVAAAPESGLRPVPFADQYDRMPWLRRDLAASDVVVAPFRHTDRLGTPAEPAPLVVDGGEVLELAGTMVAATLPFAIYRRRTDAKAEVRVEEPGARALFDGRFDTTAPLRVLVFDYRCDASSAVHVLGGDAAAEVWRTGGWIPLAPAGPRLWSIPADSHGEVRLRLRGNGTAREVVVLCDR